jgi:hypothetical protein
MVRDACEGLCLRKVVMMIIGIAMIALSGVTLALLDYTSFGKKLEKADDTIRMVCGILFILGLLLIGILLPGGGAKNDLPVCYGCPV